MRGHILIRATASLLALATAIPAAPASAEPQQSQHAQREGCHDLISFVRIPFETADALVPDRYTVRPSLDAAEMTGAAEEHANLIIDVFACERITAGDKVDGPVRGADVAVEIERPEETDSDEDDSITFDQYLLFIVTDDEDYAQWLRADSGLDVTHVPAIAYDFDGPDRGAGSFSFSAPAPAPSPFAVTGLAGAQGEEGVAVDDSWWQDTRGPTGNPWQVRLHAPRHTDFFAPAAVTITAAEGSQLYELMGDKETRQADVALSVGIKTAAQVKTVTRRVSDDA